MKIIMKLMVGCIDNFEENIEEAFKILVKTVKINTN
jgi:hypothetical protein